MVFNSFDFIVFAAVLLSTYWRLPHRGQNIFLLMASLFFYGVIDPSLLALILLCGIAGYGAGRILEADPDRHSALAVGIVVPLTVLGVFKYFDFFLEEVGRVSSAVGLGGADLAMELVLPVGISFYTFQTIGYVIDVRRGTVPAEHDLTSFLLFVTFFPQLVAGPIERADHLLPQIHSKRTLDGDDALRGSFLIAQGLVKKIVIADSLAPLVDGILALESPSGPLLLVAAVLFGAQIYCDFSGYTDIARGISRLLGFDLLLNFRQPYWSASPAEFWARWHITLSSWFRDYVYFPLGGNRAGRAATLRNLMTTMTLSGLWHGASFNFVIWGGFHGIALVAHRLFARRWDAWPRLVGWALTTSIVILGWVMFRITDGGELVDALGSIATDQRFVSLAITILFTALPYLVLLVMVDIVDSWWVQSSIDRSVPLVVAPILSLYVVAALVFGAEVSGEFIYFQF